MIRVTTPFGNLQVRIHHEYIVECVFNDSDFNYIKQLSYSELLETPFLLKGTKFDELVWNEIRKIPKGHTATYSEIASRIGKSNSSRAVANACGRNKLALIIPCHRVIGKVDLGGYKWGKKRKLNLIHWEQRDVIVG